MKRNQSMHPSYDNTRTKKKLMCFSIKVGTTMMPELGILERCSLLFISTKKYQEKKPALNWFSILHK